LAKLLFIVGLLCLRFVDTAEEVTSRICTVLDISIKRKPPEVSSVATPVHVSFRSISSAVSRVAMVRDPLY
jgi:hypothetical protein